MHFISYEIIQLESINKFEIIIDKFIDLLNVYFLFTFHFLTSYQFYKRSTSQRTAKLFTINFIFYTETIYNGFCY